MKFVYPEFLYALAAIAIPIIIHLFNFRKYKRIYFSNVEFLRDVKQQTQSQNQLKHLLVLLARILAISFLVFAFAQPYIPFDEAKDKDKTNLVSVYIDNSFSMEAEGEKGRLLNVAVNKAADIADAYSNTDKFQLLTNDFSGKQQRLLSKEAFLEELETIEISPVFKTVTNVFTRQQDALNNAPSGNKSVFILSDFQQNFIGDAPLDNHDSIPTYFIPLHSQTTSNLYVDSVWFPTPVRQVNNNEELRVRIKSIGDEKQENVPLKLIVNERQKAIGSFAIEDNSTIDTALFFQTDNPGFHQAYVEITDNPIVFDNTFYYSFEITDKINIYRIHAEKSGNYIRKLFTDDDFYRLEESSPTAVDFKLLKQSNLVILENVDEISSGLSAELRKFTESGGSILLFPGKNINMSAYNNFLQSLQMNTITQLDTGNFEVGSLAFEHPIFKGVYKKVPENIDLPKASKYYKVNKTSRSNEEVLLQLRNGNPFLSRYKVNNGSVTISYVATLDEFSNFPRHSSFVATLLRTAEFSIAQQQLFFTIGKDEIIDIPIYKTEGASQFVIRNKETGFEMLPSIQRTKGKVLLNIHGEITKAGHYELLAGEKKVAVLSFNYPREESHLYYVDENELNEFIKQPGNNNIQIIDSTVGEISKTIEQISQGSPLWKICIIIVLLFLGIEVLLLRLWR